MKNFFKITALALCISASSMSFAQSADVKGWAKQIVEAQRGDEQTVLLKELSDVITLGMMVRWGEQVVAKVTDEDKAKDVAEKIDAMLKEYKSDVFAILKKESINVEEQELLNFYTKNFTPEELKTIAAWYASPEYKKFQKLSPELAKTYMTGLEARTQKAIEGLQSKFDSKAQSIVNKAAGK